MSVTKRSRTESNNIIKGLSNRTESQEGESRTETVDKRYWFKLVIFVCPVWSFCVEKSDYRFRQVIYPV